MPAPLTGYVATLYNVMNLVGVRFNQMRIDINQAGVSAQGGDLIGCGNRLVLAATDLADAMFYFYTGAANTVRSSLNNSLTWIDTNWTAGAAITMDDILNAMLAADYDQLQQFVGLEEAYKMAVWDQPFNQQFYAALALGFRP